MNVLDRIRTNQKLAPDAVVGVRGSFPSSVKIQGDGRTVDVIANTDDIDLENEVVVPSGADTTYFFKNKSVFVDHIKATDMCVGHLRRSSAFPSNANFKAWRLQIFVHTTPLGDDILKMVEAGGLGMSVGFIPIEYGKPTADEVTKYAAKPTDKLASIVRKWKWLETSFTALPCNGSCQTMGVTGDTSKLAIIDNMLTKGLIKRDSALAVGFPVKTRHKIVCAI